jgi:predicted CopG family antitoxin
MEMDEERMIEVSPKAFDKLTRAKKENENYSDVIIRLVSTTLEGLQRRGEKEIVTQDNKRLALSVEQGKCMGAERSSGQRTLCSSYQSCVELAPELFALDLSNLGIGRSGDAPLGMRDVMDREIHSEKNPDSSAIMSLQGDYLEGFGNRRANLSMKEFMGPSRYYQSCSSRM